MERAAGLTHNDTPQVKLDKLDALLAQTSTSIQDASLFADMLSLPNDGRYPTLDPDPQRRRQRTLEALNLQMEVLSRSNPVLMIVEDVHWSDPTSLEAFGRAVDRIASHRVLLIVTFRPEFESPWIGRPHVTFLSINRLAQRDIDVMIDGVIGNKSLPASIRKDIIERTDGIPLFVEEMTKAVLEAGSEGAGGELLQRFRLLPWPCPQACTHRLWRGLIGLVQRRRWRRSGQQLGANFPMPCWLRWCANRRRNWDRRSTVSLRPVCCFVRACRRTRPICSSTHWYRTRPTARYCANRDARYMPELLTPLKANSPRLPRPSRNCWRITAPRPGLIEKAAGLWGKAGQRSLERSALVEAAAQLTRALVQIAALPATPALRREQIKLQVALVTALMHTKGYAAPETKAAAERARLLIEQAEAVGEPPEDPLLLFSVLYGFWVASYVAFDGDVMRELADAVSRARREARGDSLRS